MIRESDKIGVEIISNASKLILTLKVDPKELQLLEKVIDGKSRYDLIRCEVVVNYLVENTAGDVSDSWFKKIFAYFK